MKYRELAGGLAKKGILSAFLLDDALKLEYNEVDRNLFSPADFGISFDTAEWPAYWADILSNACIEEKEKLLKAVWDFHKFEIVFCWNYDATLDRFCRERAITTIYQELGMIRSPMLYQMDFEGLLWKSSLQRLYGKFKESVAVDHARLDGFLSAFRKGVTYTKDEVVAGLNLDPKKPTVLIPLQVEDDSNIIMGSPFKTMAAFIDFCLNQIDDLDSFNILIKKHHFQPDLVIPRVANITSLYSEFGNLSLLNAADYVITLNSSMGFEALCLGKNVLTLGKSPYCNLNFTIDLNSDRRYRLADFNDFFAQLHAEPNNLRRFLYFALFHYQLTDRMMFNEHFYGKLFRMLDTASDREQIYLADIRWHQYEAAEQEGYSEPYLPWLEEPAIAYEHLHRYAFTAQFVRGKKVLDVGSGEGYGSHILARNASSVLGVDLDEDIITHANRRYSKNNLEFKLGSIFELAGEGGNQFDVIVCFSGFDQIGNPEEVSEQIKRLLTPDGLFVTSLPNRRVEYDGQRVNRKDTNVPTLDFSALTTLFHQHFKQVKVLGQGIYSNSTIWPIAESEAENFVELVMDREPEEYIFLPKDEKVPLNFLVIATNSESAVGVIGSNLIDVSNELIHQKEKQLATLSAEKEKQATLLLQNVAELSAERERLLQNVADLSAAREQLLQDLAQLGAALEAQHRAVVEQGQELARTAWQLARLKSEQEDLRAVVESQRLELELIYTSLAWRIIHSYRRTKERLLPLSSKRREFYDQILGALKGRPNQPRESLTNDVRTEVVDSGLTSIGPAVNKVKLRTDEAVQKEDVTVSVVIPTKNGGEDFRRVLASLVNQQGFRDLEIVIVDSGSTDETLFLAERFGAKVIKILPEEFTHSYARNLGASHASGDYLLFTVQDALAPGETWLHELFSVLKNNEVVAVSCAEFPWENADLFYRAISWNHYRFLEVDREDRIMSKMDADDHLSLRKNGQLSDLACLILKDRFAKYEFKAEYGEDLDLGLRLIKDGQRVAFLGSTRIIHSHHRPAYYYLKRAYVENLFIPQVFPDYPILESDIDTLLADIAITYPAIRSMVDGGAHGLRFPCKTNEFVNRVTDKFEAALKVRYPGGKVFDSHFLDAQFQAFLSHVIQEQSPNGCAVPSPGGKLGEAVLDFTRTVFRYMEETYEFVDECVTEEFRSTLYKAFAYQCGAQLAHCYLRSSDTDKLRLQPFHTELSKGV